MDRILSTIVKTSLLCGLGLLVALSGPLRPFPAKGESLPDPTRPDHKKGHGQGSPGADEQEMPSWKLTSIIHSPQRKLAVINGEIRQAGEHVAGARIQTIRPDSVILLYRGQRRVIRLFPRGNGLNRTGNEQGANRQ